MMRIRWFVLAVAVSVIGCSDYTGLRPNTRVIGVRGVVRDAGGTPVGAAQVSILATLGACGGATEGSRFTSTNQNGQYSTHVYGSQLTGVRCVRVTATKTPLSGSTQVANVNFVVGLPTDTVTIDVTMN